MARGEPRYPLLKRSGRAFVRLNGTTAANATTVSEVIDQFLAWAKQHDPHQTAPARTSTRTSRS